MICKSRTSTETPEQRRERHRREAESKRARGICYSCPNPAAPGFVRCQKCMKKRAARCRKSSCENCGDCPPLHLGSYCQDCVRLLAQDALRTKAHSRCEDGGTLDYDLEPAERVEFEKLVQVRVIEVKPLELPTYSLRAIADVARMNH